MSTTGSSSTSSPSPISSSSSPAVAAAIAVATSSTPTSSEAWPRTRVFICGGIAGIANLMVGHPLDTIKVRMQTEGRLGRFAGPLDCFRQTIRTEGVGGLYKGLTPPLVGRIITHSLMFGIQGGVLRELSSNTSNESRETLMRSAPLHHIFISGLAAGIGMIPVCTPIDQVKACLQVQYAEERAAQTAVNLGAAAHKSSSMAPGTVRITPPPHHLPHTPITQTVVAATTSTTSTTASHPTAMRYTGPIDCAQKLIRQYGTFRGLYSYWLPSAFELSALSVYFTAYAYAFRTFVPLPSEPGQVAPSPLMPPSLAAAVAGACGGGAMMLTSYPIDVLRVCLIFHFSVIVISLHLTMHLCTYTCMQFVCDSIV
jgi:hypothetical protein